jgi:TrmH family RNA methyltransferase
MTEKIITSRDNALVKHARSVRDGKDARQILVEGLRLCEEANQALGADDIQEVIYTERIAQDTRGAKLLGSLKLSGARRAIVSQSVFASISDTKTPQGIVLLVSRPETGQRRLVKSAQETPLIVVLHRVNNPSNAGAILRTAEAAGASGAILTEGTTDIFAPKALRGAMGASFRLPLWTGANYQAALAWCKDRGIRTISAATGANTTHTEIDWTRPSAMIVGAESSGLTAEELAQADAALSIPMRAPVESLNVAVAAAIVLYEAARQRAAGSGQWTAGS